MKKKIRLPRLVWIRNPTTKVVPNKKAEQNKKACRKWKYKDYTE